MNNAMFLNFREKLCSLDEKEYIFALISYHIAPIIWGVKPASIITLRNSEKKDYSLWKRYGRSFLSLYEIESVEINEDVNEVVLFFYDKDMLEHTLNEEKVTEFLRNFGYAKEMELDHKVMHLKSRFLNNCPHEMGIFLGIPLEDVENFIHNTNKQCLMVGYWKVYSNLNRAKEIFRAYERAKDYVMKSIIDGHLPV